MNQNCFLVLIGILLIKQICFATLSITNEQNEYVKLEVAPEITTTQSYPIIIKWMFNNLFNWHPSELKKSSLSKKCEFTTTESIQEYINRCEKEITTENQNNITNALRMLSLKMTEKELSKFKRVRLILAPNQKQQTHLTARIALQDKLAPMIVLRNGVFSSADSFMAEKTYAYLFYFKMGYHVMIVENSTSPSFIQNNQYLTFGGIDESIQNIYIGKFLSDNKLNLAKQITRLHLVGISLGGQGVLYSSMLNDLNQHVYQNMIALCPAVHLQKNLEKYFYPHNLQNYFKNFWANIRMQSLWEKYPKSAEPNIANTIRQSFQLISENYQGIILKSDIIQLPAFYRQKTELWDLLESWDQYQNVQTPVSLLATVNDELVGYEINGKTLFNQSNIEHLLFPTGNHCSMPISYQWPILENIFQKLFSK